MPLLQDGLIMITWANHHYLDFAKSWVYSLRKVRTPKLHGTVPWRFML
jgi:hypothetical protein